jgi:aspartyl protease family protein
MGFMMLFFPELRLPERPLPALTQARATVLVIVSVLFLTCSVAIGADSIDTNKNENRRQVSLEGILGSKAVLSINGKRQLLSSGQQEGGIKIIKIYPNSIEVSIDGKHRRLRMGDNYAVAAPSKQRKNSAVVVAPDARGMYVTVGSINGLPVSFLVDTGATTIAMNAAQAKRLGIDFRITGQQTMVGTASGVAKAYGVTLKKVTLGSITLHNISAVVIEGGYPVQTLLGMSFLGQLDIRREGSVMRIKKNY